MSYLDFFTYLGCIIVGIPSITGAVLGIEEYINIAMQQKTLDIDQKIN